MPTWSLLKGIFNFYLFLNVHETKGKRTHCYVQQWMTETLTKIRPEKYLLSNSRPTRESFTHGAFTIAGEGLQNLGLCSALRAFEQGGSWSCHTCCDTESQFFRSWSSVFDSPNRYERGCWGPNFMGLQFSRLVRHSRLYWGTILTRIITRPQAFKISKNHFE
jgi:hypothetical protein